MNPARLSYPEVGATAADLPPGYAHLVVRHLLAPGPVDPVDAARVGEALLTWQVHAAAGVRLATSQPRAAVGVEVTTLLGVGRLRLPEPCRVVAVEDRPGSWAFAYGTLPGHVFTGEERFAVEHDDDGRLWFGVRVFSRPAWAPLRAAAPVVGPVSGVLQRGYVRVLARGARRVLGA